MINIKETPYHFEVTFPYRPNLVQEIKDIPGRRFIMAQKVWQVPLDSREKLVSWAKKYTSHPFGPVAPAISDFTVEPMPHLEIDIPLKMQMYPYQREGVAYGLKHKRCIVGDEPGLGKTGQAIAMAVAAGAKCVLVICPATLKENWRREFMKWSDRKPMILSKKYAKSWVSYNRVGMIDTVICNYESLKTYFVEKIDRPIDPETGKPKPLRLNYIHFKEEINIFDFIIIDESHRCKDGSGERTKFVMGISKGKEYVYCLTGTPVVNTPKDLVSQLYILDQLNAVFGGYKRFVDRYCNEGGSHIRKELNYMLSKYCFYRREKREVLKDLPDKVRQIVKCELENRPEYDKAATDLEKFLRENLQKTEGEINQSLRGEIMVQMMLLKKLSAMGKLESVYEFIDEIIEAGEKLVLFVHHKDVAHSIGKRYPGSLFITGDNTGESRQAAIDAFQNDSEKKLIICSIKAAGVGLTLTAASRVGFVELPWHPADADQCEDRCHRIGQKDSVQCVYFLGDNSIDEHIYDIIQEKRKIADDITGNETEIETSVVDQLIFLFRK